MYRYDFGRVIPAMISPFDKDLQLDVNRGQELAVRLADGGSDALIITGTTGESPTICRQDKLTLYRAVVEAIDGRIPVVANVGGNCTADSVELARAAKAQGVDGLMCVVPYYNKPPQEGLYRHFRTIAESVDLPIILYNIPGRCVVNMNADTTLRLANDCPNIAAVKEASGRFDQIARICQEAPEGFVVYSGDDEATLDIMDLGGVGVVSTIANVEPERFGECIKMYASGDKRTAKDSFEALRPLMKALFATTNPIMVKAALKLKGFDCGGVRLPLVDATPEQISALEKVMVHVGAI